MDQQPPTSERIETWGSIIDDFLKQEQENIPERCRSCPNFSVDTLNSLRTAALEQENRGEDTSALKTRAAESYLRIISTIGKASRGVCIGGVVGDKMSLLIEDSFGRELYVNADFCGLGEKVRYGTPEYDELCKTYARVRQQYDQSVDEVTKKQLHYDELALEAQFPDDFPEVTVPKELQTTEDVTNSDRSGRLFGLAVELISSPDGVTMRRGQVYLHGLSLLRQEADEQQ